MYVVMRSEDPLKSMVIGDMKRMLQQAQGFSCIENFLAAARTIFLSRQSCIWSVCVIYEWCKWLLRLW